MLSKRNKKILALSIVGLFLFAGSGWIIQWFATESFAAFMEMSEASDEEGHQLNGGIWWSLLAALLFSIAFAPIASAFTMLTYRNKDVSDAWIGKTYGLLAGIPMAIIWALFWLICLPFTWGLLPWGEWSINWWKIFPFGFGLIWMGGLPLVITVINFFKKLANPEYNHDLISADEDGEEDADSSSTTAEQTASEIANSVDTRSSYIEAQIPPKRSLGGRAIFVAILGVIMIIPGIVLLIIGGGMAEGFIESEGSSSYTLEIIDEDGLGDQGFIIYIQGIPGDFNGNGVHDYCENVIVNATHSGAWMSDPWTGWSSYNGVDETRQVFELEIAQKDSGCDVLSGPKEKWVNDVQLVKIGRACYGCMAGNTTITAEYVNEPTNPVGMWIQDGETVHESGVLITLGAIITGIGAVTLILLLIVKISKSKAAERAGNMPSIEEEKEPIEIIESNPGQPVCFRINDPPKGRDAWVGIYPASTGDQDHGGRWSWLRDIDVNNATLPGQPAGKWSIRVFKDGGYKLQHRVDFEISTSPQQPKTSTLRDGMHQSHTCEIQILEATTGKPIRFNVNNRPSGNEAWFGLYPDRATDQEHGEQHRNWMYFRDVAQQNTLYLPPQSAGRWSIRVFSDGGYNQIERLDFDITGAHGNVAQLHPADGRYELAPEELSWNEHNERALALGGHLVSITSAEENELVARIAGGRVVWIGGMRKGSGNGPGADHWCWCDGQPWIYANWAPGEPNNYGGNENRIQLYGQNKLWNDVGEGWRGPAVYQLPKEKSIQSAKKIQSALKQSAKEKKDNFWDSA